MFFGMKNNATAILLILLSTFGFAIQDTVVKILSSSGSLWQLMFLRALLVITILFLWSRILDRSSDIIPNSWFWPIVRGVFMCLAYTLFYASLPFVSLSEAAACFFSAPMFACILGAVILKETVGLWRVGAVLIGFCGVLLVIQPGTENIKIVLILPLLAGLSYAMAVIVTRGFCQKQPSFSLTFSHNVLYACLGALVISFLPIISISEELRASNEFLFFGWVPLTRDIIFLIGATSITHIVAMTATIRAYQMAETSFVAPLEYFYLIFAASIDYIFWMVLPGISGLAGMAIIMFSGILIAVRESINQKTLNTRKTEY